MRIWNDARAVALLGIALAVSWAHANSHYVDGLLGQNAYDGQSAVVTNGHGPKRSIAATLALASSNDAIHVAAGYYQETHWPAAGQRLVLPTTGQVFVASYNPRTTDSDSDGIPDAWEAAYLSNPHDPNDANSPSPHPWAHGLSNLQLYQNQTVLLADGYCSIGDGIPDWWKVSFGFARTDPSVGLGDADGDGYTNGLEYEQGTNPLDPASKPAAVGLISPRTGRSTKAPAPTRYRLSAAT